MGDVDKTNNSVELKIEDKVEQTEVKKSSRRPDIDLIRILLTWGILLYHAVLIYTPSLPYYLKLLPHKMEDWHWSSFWFVISMNAWNMPMFFFLSGISAFFGLKKRDGFQFREERIHRLLVPALFLSLTSSFFTGLDFYSKLSPNCQEFSQFQNISLKPEAGYDWAHCAMFYPVRGNETYGQYLRKMFLPVPSTSQGWFLCYLFVYSQLFTPLILLVHPILIVGCSPRVVRHSILENNRSKLGPAGPAKDYRKGSPSWQELEEKSGYRCRNCPHVQRKFKT